MGYFPRSQIPHYHIVIAAQAPNGPLRRSFVRLDLLRLISLRRSLLTIGFVLAVLIGVYVIGQSAPTRFESFACQHLTADEMAEVLRVLLPTSDNLELVVDREQNRILLSGPDRVQAMARRAFEEIDRPEQPPKRTFRRKSSTAKQTKARPTAQTTLANDESRLPDNLFNDRSSPWTAIQQLEPSAPAPKADESLFRVITVDPASFAQIQRQLSSAFGRQLAFQRVGGRQFARIPLARQPEAALEVEFDHRRGGLSIGGPTDAVNQLAYLVESLRQDLADPNQQTRAFPVARRHHRQVEQLLHAPGPAAVAERITPTGFQQIDTGPQPSDEPESPPMEKEEAEGPTLPVRPFEGVEVKSLPDLDVIILRGRDKDLSQLADIIEQLERIGEENQPEIRVYKLEHAQSESVADVVTQSNKDLISGRTGKATVTPLVKPNALLVIGWGETFQTMLKLIAELDQPVSPQTQSATFRLKHATASDVQKALTAFFTNRKGLGAKVQTTIDNRTNSVIVYAAPRDLQEVRRIIRDLDLPDSAAVHQAKIFPLEHSLAADVAATLTQAIKAATGAAEQSSILELQTFDAEGQRILRSGTLDNVRITPSPRNNSLIVSCTTQNLELIAELIRQLDSPAVEAQIKVFEIINGDAASLVQTLRSLLPSQAGTTTGLQLPSSAEESSLAPLRFSVDVRSNSIIATGSEGDLRIVEALLVKLDQSTTVQRKSAVYHLKNAPALDVATAINQFLVSRRRVELAAPGQDNPFQELEREVVVVPEPVGNKLILAATPRLFDEINQLIEKLDQQPPQVMIQVLIAEVDLNNTDEFGMELGLQDSVLFDRSLLGNLITTTDTTTTSTAAGVVTATNQIIRSATNVPGFAFNSIQPLGNSGSTSSLRSSNLVGGQGISNFDVGRGNNQLGFGGLVLSASSQNVSVLLRALQESRRVDILSRPQVRTLDNQSAFIQVGQRVPRIIGTQVNQAGQSNQVTLENVGLILAVTPRISPQGTVVMEIDAEKSSLGTDADGIPVAVSTGGTVIRSPRIDTTTAQATVSAADGETIVLGGLITESSNQFHRQVPWLGDLPVLGHLFRYDGVARQRTELLIILTPHVIRSQEDEERLRQTEMAHMSWCAADVVEFTGSLSLPSTAPMEWIDRGMPETIYPDLNPAGEPMPLPEGEEINQQSGVIPAEHEVEDQMKSELPEKEAKKKTPSSKKKKKVSRRKTFASRSR